MDSVITRANRVHIETHRTLEAPVVDCHWARWTGPPTDGKEDLCILFIRHGTVSIEIELTKTAAAGLARVLGSASGR